jgi:hypothetical protein
VVENVYEADDEFGSDESEARIPSVWNEVQKAKY